MAQMKKAELQEFKELLENLQARLRGDVRQLTTEALGSDRQDAGSESKSPTHMAELGSEAFEQDFALSLVVNQQETLAEIAAALLKIKDGTYGLCEQCLKDEKTAAHAAIKRAAGHFTFFDEKNAEAAYMKANRDKLAPTLVAVRDAAEKPVKSAQRHVEFLFQ